MKTIIAGSRGFTDLDTLIMMMEKLEKFPNFWKITEVVSGCAKGADTLGEDYADLESIPKAKFPADWKTHGKKAGYLRNSQMAEYADAAICFWDGESRGTAHMINLMDQIEKPCIIVRIDRDPPVIMVNKWYGQS